MACVDRLVPDVVTQEARCACIHIPDARRCSLRTEKDGRARSGCEAYAQARLASPAWPSIRHAVGQRLVPHDVSRLAEVRYPCRTGPLIGRSEGKDPVERNNCLRMTIPGTPPARHPRLRRAQAKKARVDSRLPPCTRPEHCTLKTDVPQPPGGNRRRRLLLPKPRRERRRPRGTEH